MSFSEYLINWNLINASFKVHMLRYISQASPLLRLFNHITLLIVQLTQTAMYRYLKWKSRVKRFNQNDQFNLLL